MLQNRMRSVILWCLLAGSAAAQAPAEFSAVMVQNSHGTITKELVYSGKSRMRIEPDSSRTNAPIVLLDFDEGTSYLLMPYQKSFIQISGAEGAPKQRITLLKPVDPARPCDSLVSNADKNAVPCRNAGPGQLNGRNVTKWVGTLPDGQEGYVWMDNKLDLIVKLETPGNKVELQDIQEQAQDPELFTIPSGYARIRMGPTQPAGKE